MTVNDKDMQNAFAIIDFSKYVEEEYLSVCLEGLLDSVKNPIKRQQLEALIELAWKLEGMK